MFSEHVCFRNETFRNAINGCNSPLTNTQFKHWKIIMFVRLNNKSDLIKSCTELPKRIVTLIVGQISMEVIIH